MRTVERLEGLAAAGSATIGPLRTRVPGLIRSRPNGSSEAPTAAGPSLSLTDRGTAGPGQRALDLWDGSQSLPLDLPVPAPEVSGEPGFACAAGTGVWAVRWPLSDAQWTEVGRADPEALLLLNARALFSEGEPFVRAVGELRERLGARPLLWTPRVALPHRLALLGYLGVDLVDTTEALWRSLEGTYLDTELGTLDAVDAAAERSCACPACRSGESPTSGAHADFLMDAELARVRTALRGGRLRELVEARLTAEPLLAEILRYADRGLGGLLEERSPVTGGPVRGYVFRESQRRPEVRRYRDRFFARYRPPPSKQVLVLVPCSKTKPYRSSRSHRRLARALEGLEPFSRLHVVSVTSPLGLVPRELEDMPPARHYDIPVTGEWDEAEQEAVVLAVLHLLSTGSYASVIAHLDPDEYSFLEPALRGAKSVEWTMADDRTTSSEALATLRRGAQRALASVDPVRGGPMSVVRQELEAVAGMQFGPEAARCLFQDPVRLQGRPWFQRVTDGGKADLATWREDRGLFQLTVAGAQRMLPAHPLEVEVAEGVPLTGDLFVPGVAHADPGIRVGDAVVLVRAGALLGVGEAALPGRLMAELRRGPAVLVRHRAHSPGPPSGPTAP
jgi:archaeosine synthase